MTVVNTNFIDNITPITADWLNGVNGVVNALSTSTGAAQVGVQQTGTGAVVRTVQDRLRDTVSIKDFGALGDGVADDRLAIQAAINTGKSVYFPAPAVAYFISDQLQPMANQMLYGDGANSYIQVVDGSKNAIYGNGVDGVVVRDLKISTKNQVNATAYKGAVVAFNCRNWLVQNVLAFNMGHWGVSLYDSSNCKVTGCRFSSFFGAVQDSTDIAIYNNSSFNLIEGNFCYAQGADHGIFMQDPYSGATPTGNRIVGNMVSEHKSDGIAVYVTTAYDTRTLIANNDVRDILGTALSGQSGHGIYVQSASGTTVTGNTITNCCRSTTSFETQAVAGIGVAIGEYATGYLTEVIVANNHVNATRGPGIYAATSGMPVSILGNTVVSGSVESVRGEAIRAINVQRAQIVNNIVRHVNPNYNAISVIASNEAMDGIDISGNTVTTAKYGIQVGIVGTGTFTNMSVTRNRVAGGNDQAINITNVTRLAFHGNIINTSGVAAVFQGCPSSRMTGNIFTSPYAPYSMIFTGTMTGSIVDESNLLTGRIENDGGTILSQYGAAQGAGGNIWAVGDRVIQSVPGVGSPKGWRCTVAGNPGTWVSEGNL